jgi:phosphatidate cytidylyltransferase
MAGGFYFFAFVVILSSIALAEYYSLARAKGAHPQTWTGIAMGILLSADFMYVRFRDAILTVLDRAGISLPLPSMPQYFLMLVMIYFPLLLIVELFRGKGSPLVNVSVTLLGTMYVSLFFGALIGVREIFIPSDFPVYIHFAITGVSVSDEVATTIYRWGGLTVVTIFSSIWMCDSAAYFAGRAFGRHKLFERVSPHKTWEGAIAGFAVAVAAFILGRQVFLPYLTLPQAIVCGSIIGLFGQVGDLVESMLKRDSAVKDSSTLIPGHGGVLDRFDSLMFVSPLLFLYLDFIVF